MVSKLFSNKLSSRELNGEATQHACVIWKSLSQFRT